LGGGGRGVVEGEGEGGGEAAGDFPGGVEGVGGLVAEGLGEES
jgi:hypothetical protein